MPLPTKTQKEIPNINKDSSMFISKVNGFETKTLGDGNLSVEGYIATTHLDEGFFDEVRGVYIKDKISSSTLHKWAEEINEGIPRANKVSVNHNREPHVTGVGVKGSARVDILPDGHYGLFVKSIIDKTKSTFEDVAYRVENNLLDSFSIEFQTRDPLTDDYIPGAVSEVQEGNGMIRELLPETILGGWTLASQPMNTHAIMLKEILQKKQTMEDKTKMSEEVKNEEVSEEVSEEKTEEAPEEKSTKSRLETKEEVEDEAPADNDSEELAPEEVKEFRKFQARRSREAKEVEITSITNRVKEELKESLKGLKVENKIQVNNDNIESKEYVEYKEIFSKDSRIGVDAQFKIAAEFAESKGLISADTWAKPRMKSIHSEYKNFRVNNNKLEFKNLGITTNQNTDTDYLLSAAELSDVFDPVIYNHLNQKTTTWNILPKDDYSNKGNNQVQFAIKTGKNVSASAYTGNAVATSNVDRTKYMTKFKKYQVGVEVDGDMIAAARGSTMVGDVFAQEVKDSTDDLMEVMNQALYAEVGLETAAGVIGFEYITDGAGNASLYNVTRTAANQLLATTATDTYINGSSLDVTVSQLRKAVRNAIEEGADLGNIVFFCSPIQYDKIKALYDDLQRLVPTSSRFGFEGRIEFDGVPVFYDKDCNDDDIFLVDTETHRIAIWVPPTLEMLGKDSDSQKGFIKSYWCTYNRAPRRMVQIYSLKTT
jgi:hypothetical protein